MGSLRVCDRLCMLSTVMICSCGVVSDGSDDVQIWCSGHLQGTFPKAHTTNRSLLAVETEQSSREQDKVPQAGARVLPLISCGLSPLLSLSYSVFIFFRVLHTRIMFLSFPVLTRSLVHSHA